MKSPFEQHKDQIEAFVAEVGGTLQGAGLEENPPAITVEWFQKEILRGVSIRLNLQTQTYILIAYASRVKRNEKFSRKQGVSDIPMDRPLLDILREGRALSQSFMEKSFLPWDRIKEQGGGEYEKS